MSDNAPQTAPTPPPGWYSDPTNGRVRWWDGTSWGMFAPVYPVTMPIPVKSTGSAYALAILLGGFGAHNFYVGRTGVAVTQLVLTIFGLFAASASGGPTILSAIVFVWVVVDLFLIPRFTHQANVRLATSAVPSIAS